MGIANKTSKSRPTRPYSYFFLKKKLNNKKFVFKGILEFTSHQFQNSIALTNVAHY